MAETALDESYSGGPLDRDFQLAILCTHSASTVKMVLGHPHCLILFEADGNIWLLEVGGCLGIYSS